MPDIPESNKRVPELPQEAALVPRAVEYAELHCKTNFSFLEGASHPDELVVRAAELGYRALAITDAHSVAGVVRAHGAAKEVGLKLLIGAEIRPADAPAVVLWATDRASYGRLARLITVGRRRAEKGDCRLTFADVAEHGEGLVCGVVLDELRSTNYEVRRTKDEGRSTKDEGRNTKDEGRNTETRRGAAEDAFSRGEGEREIVKAESRKRKAAQAEASAFGSRLSAFDQRDSLHTLRSELCIFRDAFPDRTYALAELHCGPSDEQRLAEWRALAQAARIPLVAAGNVHYHHRNRLGLHHILTAIRLGRTVDQAREYLQPNAEYCLQDYAALVRRFAQAPEAVARSLEIAERCTFSLDELRYEYPEELAPAGETPLSYLTRLTWAGAAERYPRGVPPKVRSLVEHELSLIADLRYEAYFLTVYDLVRFARERGILCQGRGSAANSAVCFCLGVTSVDPEKMDVLFERFVSRERKEAPDIDIDFEHERREEVLQYLYDKYGRERAGMAAEVITYRPRSAVRDVGKALGLSLDRVDALAKSLEGYRTADASLPERCRGVGIDPESKLGRQLVGAINELMGFPRHLGQHVGGMVMTQGPLCELVPIENAAMEGRTVIQWDKNDLDEVGILKVDCLALGMLTAIRKCFELIQRHYHRPLTLATVPPEDPKVYDMICQADTMGVFQIESRAQMSMLPRLRPREFYDLVIEVAIVRPGPIQGDMVHPYLRRRNGEEEVAYPNEAIREVLRKTLGVPLFQEQAMRLAVVAAGFTPGEADALRRAMGAWRRPGIIEQFRQKLIEGMLARGLSQQFAEQVFNQIRGFGEYGFPESHAASFALLVYVSAWLKCHYPDAFCAALLNSQPMGFYAPAQLVRNARDHGVEVLGVDVNCSGWDCDLQMMNDECGMMNEEQAESIALVPTVLGGNGPCAAPRRELPTDLDPHRGAARTAFPRGAWEREMSSPIIHRSSFIIHHLPLRLGLRQIVGLGEADGRAIEAARRWGPFLSITDFAQRTGLAPGVISRLAAADAFGSLALDRRGALWQALAVEPPSHDLPLLKSLPPEDDPLVPLPQMPPQDEVFADYRTTSLSLREHPIAFHREWLTSQQILPAGELVNTANGRMVRVAGLVLVRQRPGTAKGITFVTIEDETGAANLIVRPDVWQKFYRAARTASALVAHGRLQHQHDVIHVLVTKLEDLSELIRGMRSQSRDFH
jgi:error-prone DNA polymerase